MCRLQPGINWHTGFGMYDESNMAFIVSKHLPSQPFRLVSLPRLRTFGRLPINAMPEPTANMLLAAVADKLSASVYKEMAFFEKRTNKTYSNT